MRPHSGKAIPLSRRLLADRVFLTLCLTATTAAIVILALLLISICIKGMPWILDMAAIRESFSEGGGGLGAMKSWVRWEFFTEYTSRRAANAGIRAPLWGSIWVTAICAATALPLGVGTAIYLEEFAPRNRVTRFIETNIRNLAGVPSIVYGILGLTAFVRIFGLVGAHDPIEIGDPESFFHLSLPFGRSVLAGGLTLTLVILPIVIIAAQEAFRAVPNSLREASLAMGATRWQSIRKVTLPAALPMILTGAILAISRAIGEAAPLLVFGIPLWITSVPENLMSEFTILPLYIFNWTGRPPADFQGLAAAAIIVLLVVLLSFNALAVFIRQKLHKQLA